MNLAFKYPTIYWNCACLITDSGGNENDEENEDSNKTNNYGKIATAIGKMRKEGINVVLPDINTSTYTFYPDEDNNKIFYGLRGIVNVGDDLINDIVKNRPYKTIKEFYVKVKPNKQAMIALIKSGIFDNLIDRKKAMVWYIWNTCDKKKRLTLQNMGSFIKYKLLPTDTEEQITARRVYEFNRYLKACCLEKKGDLFYKLNERAINFLVEINLEGLINSDLSLNIKQWDKVYSKWMDVFRNWINSNKEELLDNLNYIIFKEDWDKYDNKENKGNISAWEMEALGFYYHNHELSNIDARRYGFKDFFSLPKEPIIDKWFEKGGKRINMYKLVKICGTCISKNKNKGTVTLLTTTGVVNVKFRKEYFSLFDKQISRKNPDGTKTVLERSWFNRGNMIVVMGIRSNDDFIVKKYASSVGEQLYHIDSIEKNGTLTLRHERAAGEEEDGED